MTGAWGAVLVRSPAPLALMVLIFWLSGQSDPGPDVGPAVRILGHAAEFGLLALLWGWALAPRLGLRRSALVAAAIAFAYAVSDEYHQTHVPGRDGTVSDVAVDSVGIAIAFALMRWRADREPRDRREAGALEACGDEDADDDRGEGERVQPGRARED